MTDELLIEQSLTQTRVALVEDGRLVDFAIETEGSPNPIGAIWLGRVARAMPAMGAAFVELGLDRPGLLHAADTILVERPVGPVSSIDRLPREGQAILVQASRAPVGNKGVKLTTNIAIPGRRLVLMPFGQGAVVARRIGDGAERRRLSAAMAPLLRGDGCILRTAAMGATPEALAAELARLRERWDEIRSRRQNAEAPVQLWRDADAIERALRDYAGPAIAAIRLDHPAAFAAARSWAQTWAPEIGPRIARFDGPGNLFDLHDVNGDVAMALSSRVDLPSGAVLHFGATAALAAIDVDLARAAEGGAGRTTLAVNQEAAREIARQLRLRAIGGLVVIDFLRMDDADDRAATVAALRQALARDPAPTRVLPVSELGLVEMTRKRIGEPLGRRLTESCESCGGVGRRPSVASVLAELSRRAEREARARPGRPLTAICAPDVAAALRGELAARLALRLGAAVSVRAEPGKTRGAFEILLA